MTDYVSALERNSLDFVDALDRDPLIGGIVRGDACREDYVRFLKSTYQYVRWSGFLLSRTAEGLRRSGRYPWLVELVDAKAAEESPHDAWALGDLESCGVPAERVREAPEPTAVRAYVHWGAALAEDGSPAFLGAAYTLEFISMQRARRAADSLRAKSAIPNIANALSFLDGHGEADSEHVAELSRFLRRIAEPADREAVELSSAVLRALYPRFFHAAPAGESS